jgi:methionine aminopeptidase
MARSKLADIRRAVAYYMLSEGCSCCRDIEKHKENTARLAKLLRVPKYSDGSGYNFVRFRTPIRRRQLGVSAKASER